MENRTFLLFFALLLISLIMFQGCLKSASSLCIENMDDVFDENYHLTGTDPVINPDSGYSGDDACCVGDSCSPCNGRWYDCSDYLSTGYCKVCALRNNAGMNCMQYDVPLDVPACPDTTLLNEKCKFGCDYFVCTKYTPKSNEKTSISPADLAQDKRRGNNPDALLPISSSGSGLINTASVNFLHSTCSFETLTQDEFKRLKKQNALFITYRLGAGRNFEDFELANALIPISSSSTGLNPNAGVDRYELYFTEQMKHPDQVKCVKDSDGFWKIEGYIPNTVNNERINRFTTFADCMLNSHPDYLGDPNKQNRRPFVPESFCYSQDYLEKHLPYLDEDTGEQFSKRRFVLYLTPTYSSAQGSSDHTLSYDMYELSRWVKDARDPNIPSFKFEAPQIIFNCNNRFPFYEYTGFEFDPERSVDEYYNFSSGDYGYSSASFEGYQSCAVPYNNDESYKSLSDQEKRGGLITFLEEGKNVKEAYTQLFKKIPQYYEQFKEGSKDKQGRRKLGAEFECLDGTDCYSTFCDKSQYERTSCSAIDSNGNLIEVACGCTMIDCDHFYPDSYELYDNTEISKDSENKPYLMLKDIDEKHAKVYVMKQNNYGRGPSRFFYWVNLGSEPYIDPDTKSIVSDKYVGVVLKDQSGGWKDKTIKDVCNRISDDGLTLYSSASLVSNRYIHSGNPVWSLCDYSMANSLNYFFSAFSFLGDIELTEDDSDAIFLSYILCGGQGCCVDSDEVLDVYNIDPTKANLHNKYPDLNNDKTSEYYCMYPIRGNATYRTDASNTEVCCSEWEDNALDSCGVGPLYDICTDFSGCNGQYNILEEEPVWSLFEGFVYKDTGDGREKVGVKSLFRTADLREFRPNIPGAGPYISASIVSSVPEEPFSKTFVEEDSGNKNMFLVNYVVARPEDLNKLYETYNHKDWIFQEFNGGEDDPVLSNNINAYLFDIPLSGEAPLAPISYKSSSSTQVTEGIQELKRCAATGPSSLIIPKGGETSAPTSQFKVLSDYLTLGPKAYPDIRTQGNTASGTAFIDFTILSRFVDIYKLHPEEFPVYDNCRDSSHPIQVGFCFNPYFVKYDEYDGETGAYTGESLYSVSTILTYYDWPDRTSTIGRSISDGLRDALVNYFDLCKDIPPKYYCLGVWSGDPYTGTCYGDMAISAYIFNDSVSDGYFGRCIYNDTNIVHLNVHEFGVCEANTPFNMAFDEIQSDLELSYGSSSQRYLLNLSAYTSSSDPQTFNPMVVQLVDKAESIFDEDFFEEIGKIKGATKAFIDTIDSTVNKVSDCFNRPDSDFDPPNIFPYNFNEWNPYMIKESNKKVASCSWWKIGCKDKYTCTITTSYLYNNNLWEYIFKNPLTNIYVYSYTLPIKGFLYFYNFYNADGHGDPEYTDYSGFYNYYLYKSSHSLSKLPVFFGAFTKHSTEVEKENGNLVSPQYSDLHTLAPEVSFYSDPTFNPDNFYPSRNYLLSKLGSYLKRGILPVLITDDPDLYVDVPYVHFLTGDTSPGGDYNSRRFKDNTADHIFPVILYETKPLYLYKVLTDVQQATRVSLSKNGFNPKGEMPLGSVVVISNKLLFRQLPGPGLGANAQYQTKNNYNLLNWKNNPIFRAKMIKDGCPTCLVGVMVDINKSNVISLSENDSYSMTDDDVARIVNNLVELFAPSTFAYNPPTVWYSSVDDPFNPDNIIYCNDGRELNNLDELGNPIGIGSEHRQCHIENLDVIVYKVVLDVRGIKEDNARSFVDRIVLLSNRTMIALGKPNILYIKDLVYSDESELNLFFSYLNYRKPDLISAGNMGIQFEDVIKRDNTIPSSGSSGIKHMYLISKSAGGRVEPGLCQITKNLLPIGGLLTLKSVSPLFAYSNCTSNDCINSSSQCLPSATEINGHVVSPTLFCRIKKGDGEMSEFYVTSYNPQMADFIGLSLTQTGFTLCDYPAENSTVYKTLAVPAQYVVPITYSNSQSEKCYPSTVTPQELQEIFTSGIKFATCYPVWVSASSGVQ